MSTSHQRSVSASSSKAKRNGKATTPPVVPPQTSAPLPAPDDRDGWRVHWSAQGQPWRTEPEIDQQRQAELEQRRAIVPNLEQGIYSFADMKLSRADVEWLLATHDHGRGPVDWDDMSQRSRTGLDLRGADLRGVHLSGLPLARLRGGMTKEQWLGGDWKQKRPGEIHLEGAILRQAHLEGSYLREAHLEGVDLLGAYLGGIDLFRAHLEGANLAGAHLVTECTHLAPLPYAPGDFEHFPPTILRRVFFDGATNLEGIDLGRGSPEIVRLGDISWNGANLSRVDWSVVTMLGDERQARQKLRNGKKKDRIFHTKEYIDAARASRQLAVILQSQGLNIDSARFAYRAQALERHVFRLHTVQPGIPLRQRIQALSAFLFSWFLFLIAGYGYKPGRSFLTYFLVIFGFATAYYFLGHSVGPSLTPLGAFVFSMTSFHGRGFFPGNNISLDDPLTVLAAFEALVGLIIEVTFIATLTQRFFSR